MNDHFCRIYSNVITLWQNSIHFGFSLSTNSFMEHQSLCIWIVLTVNYNFLPYGCWFYMIHIRQILLTVLFIIQKKKGHFLVFKINDGHFLVFKINDDFVAIFFILLLVNLFIVYWLNKDKCCVCIYI